MKQWYLKTFKKRDIVKIHVLLETGRVRSYYAIPDTNGVVNVSNFSFLLNKEATYLSEKNIPTYFANYLSSGVINIHLKDKPKYIPYDAEDFRTVIDNDMAKKVFKASKGNALDVNIMIIIVVILGFLLLGYYFNTQIMDLKDLITAVPEEVIPYGEG